MGKAGLTGDSAHGFLSGEISDVLHHDKTTRAQGRGVVRLPDPHTGAPPTLAARHCGTCLESQVEDLTGFRHRLCPPHGLVGRGRQGKQGQLAASHLPRRCH